MMDSAGHFVEALTYLNTNAGSLASTIEAMEKAFSSRPKLTRPPSIELPSTEPEKSDEELENEYWESQQAAKTIGNIAGGEFNSATIMSDLRGIEKKIDDVSQAQKLGIITTLDAVRTTLELNKEYAELTAVAAGKALGGEAGAKLASAAKRAPGAAYEGGMSQITGLATGMMGLLGGTAIAGGLFGLMLHGVISADRLAAEAGEITNVFSAAGATGMSNAMAHFSSFQEKAQTFYGISRQEVQGVLKEFLFAGVSVNEILQGGRKGIGEVGQDVVTLTLGMDKMFELSAGFTAHAAMQVVKQQGLGVGDAVDRIMKIEMLAHRSGTGVESLTNEALQAAIELRDYGVTVDSVAMSMVTLQDRFKDIGLNSQAAMEYAQQGTKEIAGGLKSAGLGVQVMLAEQLGEGGGLQGRYGMMDSLSKGTQRDFQTMAQGLYEVSRKQTSGTHGGSDEVRQREYLEQQGFGFTGAKSIFAIGEQVSKGRKIDEITKDEWAEIQKSFKTEGSKVSEIQKNEAKLSKDFAKLGQGILLTITNFMSFLIISVKTLMSGDWKLAMVEGVVRATVGDGAANALHTTVGAAAKVASYAVGANVVPDVAAPSQSLAMFREQWKATEKGAKKAYSGLSDSTSTVLNIVKPLMQPINMAMSLGDDDEDEEDDKEPIQGRAGLTPAFWRKFDAMCGRLGIAPGELKKVIMAETGWNAWGDDRVNYAINPDGTYKLGPDGKRIAQAKGLGSWIHSTAINVAHMTEAQWLDLQNMPASQQLTFLERTFKAMGVRGKTAEQIHGRQFGAGYRATNPFSAYYVSPTFWQTKAGKEFLAANPGYKPKNDKSQAYAYSQNKNLDREGKGYISQDDVDSLTMVCPTCHKVVFNCKCPKVKIVRAVRANTTSGPEVQLTFHIETAAAITVKPSASADAGLLPRGMGATLSAMGLAEETAATPAPTGGQSLAPTTSEPEPQESK